MTPPATHPPLLPAADWLRGHQALAALTATAGVGALVQGGVLAMGLTALGAGAVMALAGALLGRRPVLHGPLLFVDTIALTAILAVSGGVGNPLVGLYIVPVIVAALVLPPVQVWGIFAATGLGYGSLFGLAPSPHMGHAGMAGHLVGMFAVYAAAGPIVALALLHARRVTARAEAQEHQARALQARTERLAALATLAAGAAHELATPLSTILVVARELEQRADDEETVEDALLVREEVARCQDILHQLAADAGQGMGETPVPVALPAFLDRVVRGATDVVVVAPELRVPLPRRLVVQALRRLVGNARDAQGPGVPVRLTATRSERAVTFTVEDTGPGMAPAVLARACEPFFTTKADGQGTGLGLFFVHSVAAALGGSLHLDSRPGAGTRAVLSLPVPPALRPEDADARA